MQKNQIIYAIFKDHNVKLTHNVLKLVLRFYPIFMKYSTLKNGIHFGYFNRYLTNRLNFFFLD